MVVGHHVPWKIMMILGTRFMIWLLHLDAIPGLALRNGLPGRCTCKHAVCAQRMTQDWHIGLLGNAHVRTCRVVSASMQQMRLDDNAC